MKRLNFDILGFKKAKDILGFDDTGFYFFGCLINTNIMMGILYMDMILRGPYDRFALLWIGVFCYVTLHWYLMRVFYLSLVKNYPGYDNRMKRMVLLPYVLVIYFLLTLILDVLLDPLLEIKDPLHQRPSLFKELITGTFMVIIDVGIYEALHLFVELRNTKVKQAKLEKEHLSSQLASLRNQISPHFLFNSLNTLIYLIDEDKEKGKEFVHKLSFIYNCILQSSNKDLVTVQEEMKFIETYTGLLRERFGSNLNVNFNVGEKEQHMGIVPLALQVGIENVVKHNVISRQHPLTINVVSNRDYITIENNLQKRKTNETSLKMGLNNIDNRYRLLGDRKLIVEQSTESFKVKLPLLEAPKIV